jgi:UDP:flavonoid glycosyltransferase YjiC (YdhE family)
LVRIKPRQTIRFSYKAFSAGVPQVLLPAWTDCYDFANRVELLGVGRWANKKAKPRWKEDELSDAIIETLFGTESAQMKKTAREVASRHPEWKGRHKAAKEILGYLA